jgi:zinc transporter, ZIP family
MVVWIEYLFDNVLLAFVLTLFAGLSTGIGSAIAFYVKHTNTKLLSTSLGFSAGVMIFVSFTELYSQANDMLTIHHGEFMGSVLTAASFFTGIFLIAIIDRLIPSFENPHEAHRVEELKDKKEAEHFRTLYRVGIFTALALAIHNVPEGLVTFVGTLSDPSLGFALAIAIAIHNIPEGIAISIPIYYATRDRTKAFMYSFLSGLAEPAGALIGFVLLMPYLDSNLLALAFSFVAGIMVFISLDELLPAARKFGHHHLSIYGLIAGMIVMAISLVLL